MKLILHIGMGKTGTTSIQHALRTGSAQLSDQQVFYLGMWFSQINSEYHGLSGEQLFYQLDPLAKSNAADRFVEVMQAKQTDTGAHTFIMSNEAMFEQAESLTPFLNRLGELVELNIITYIRDPHEWLPSAFTQWGVRHKTHPGALLPFAEQARKLMRMYDSYPVWVERFSQILTIRRYDPSIDVVQDFAAYSGIKITPAIERKLVREEEALILLRAAFNNRFREPVLPDMFDTGIIPPGQKVGRLPLLADLCFGHEGIASVVQERRPLFERMRDQLGPDFDFLSDNAPEHAPHDYDAIQSRLIDYLVEISFTQSDRIRKLEDQVKLLQTEIQKK